MPLACVLHSRSSVNPSSGRAAGICAGVLQDLLGEVCLESDAWHGFDRLGDSLRKLLVVHGHQALERLADQRPEDRVGQHRLHEVGA
jgi:hypothetical protein